MHPSNVSERKLAANRANAAHSTGPRTAAGKAASSQNARKHGFAVDDYLVSSLDGENDLIELRADLIPVYQPVNAQELHALDRIALAQQALLRVSRLEAGLLVSTLNRGAVEASEPIALTRAPFINGDNPLLMTRDQKRNFFLAEGWGRTAVSSPETWKLFLRYQAQTERNCRRAVEEFERLKALRPQGEDAPKPLELDLMAGFRPSPPAEASTVSPVPDDANPDDQASDQETAAGAAPEKFEGDPAPAVNANPAAAASPHEIEPVPVSGTAPAADPSDAAAGEPTAHPPESQATTGQLEKPIFPNEPTKSTQPEQSELLPRNPNEPTTDPIDAPSADHPDPNPTPTASGDGPKILE